MPVFNQKANLFLRNVSRHIGKGHFDVMHYCSAAALDIVCGEFERRKWNSNVKRMKKNDVYLSKNQNPWWAPKWKFKMDTTEITWLHSMSKSIMIFFQYFGFSKKTLKKVSYNSISMKSIIFWKEKSNENKKYFFPQDSFELHSECINVPK